MQEGQGLNLYIGKYSSYNCPTYNTTVVLVVKINCGAALESESIQSTRSLTRLLRRDTREDDAMHRRPVNASFRPYPNEN